MCFFLQSNQKILTWSRPVHYRLLRNDGAASKTVLLHNKQALSDKKPQVQAGQNRLLKPPLDTWKDPLPGFKWPDSKRVTRIPSFPAGDSPPERKETFSSGDEKIKTKGVQSSWTKVKLFLLPDNETQCSVYSSILLEEL